MLKSAVSLRTRLIANWSADYLPCLSVGVSLSNLVHLGVKPPAPCSLLRPDYFQSGWAVAFHAWGAVCLRDSCCCLTALENRCQADKKNPAPFLERLWCCLQERKINTLRAHRSRLAAGQTATWKKGFGKAVFLGSSWRLPDQVQHRCRLGSYNAAFTRNRIFAHTLKFFSLYCRSLLRSNALNPVFSFPLFS